MKDDDYFELDFFDIRIGVLSDFGSIVSIGNLINIFVLRDNNIDGVWG